MKLVARRRSTKEKEHLLNLYSKVKGQCHALKLMFLGVIFHVHICTCADGYNLYMELIGGAIGMKAYAELRQGNKVFTIADDSPLLHFLSGEPVLCLMELSLLTVVSVIGTSLLMTGPVLFRCRS